MRAILTVLLFAGAAACASAALVTTSVKPEFSVTRCNVVPGTLDDVYNLEPRFYRTAPKTLPHVEIAYVNKSDKIANLVDIALVGQAMFIRTIRDTGTISPNATIAKNYPLTRIEASIAKHRPHCIVRQVHFRDGTLWSDGGALPFVITPIDQ